MEFVHKQILRRHTAQQTAYLTIESLESSSYSSMKKTNTGRVRPTEMGVRCSTRYWESPLGALRPRLPDVSRLRAAPPWLPAADALLPLPDAPDAAAAQSAPADGVLRPANA